MKIRTVAVAAAIVLGGIVAPAVPASALDDVSAGPVSVTRYECDPTVTSKCQPVDCTDQPLGQECRRACVDDACVWHTPGGWRADLDGACLYLGSSQEACANGFDGCAARVWGVEVGTC